jgi:hypothetical protein
MKGERDTMVKSQARLQAEATLPPELLIEFEAFLEDYRAACQAAGIRPIFNYTKFAHMIRHGRRKTTG